MVVGFQSINPVTTTSKRCNSIPCITRFRNQTFTTLKVSKKARLHSNQIIYLSSSPKRDVAVILLAGGVGKRMQAGKPKQFLELGGKTVVEHSINLMGHMPEVGQLILVLDKQYRDQFQHLADEVLCDFQFADPGKERQDSVCNGLDLVASNMALACVHDSARPLVSLENIRDVLEDARKYGAAVLGVPSKATIKESEDGQFVLRTIPRERLWEIQTPQVVKPDLLRRGFENVKENGLAVTDDVSIVEHLGEPVKITMGEYTNIKLTTPEDMSIAESILIERARQKLVQK